MGKIENKNAKILVIMGSDSDWQQVSETVKTLSKFGVKSEIRVLSAHRTPDRAIQVARNAEKNGFCVIIAAAGGAAHLPGVLAANTILPVIGIPIKGGSLNGVDSLLSIVQMPAGIPVATVTLGNAGPVNAAILALEILALNDKTLMTKLKNYRKELVARVIEADKKVAMEASELTKETK